MKVRQGYVSNSSSSSFVIFGVKLTIEEADKFDKNLEEKYPESEYSNRLSDAAVNLDLFAYFPEYNEDEMCIGMHMISTYNESINEMPEVTNEEKSEVTLKLQSLGINKEPKLYICGSSS